MSYPLIHWILETTKQFRISGGDIWTQPKPSLAHPSFWGIYLAMYLLTHHWKINSKGNCWPWIHDESMIVYQMWRKWFGHSLFKNLSVIYISLSISLSISINNCKNRSKSQTWKKSGDYPHQLVSVVSRSISSRNHGSSSLDSENRRLWLGLTHPLGKWSPKALVKPSCLICLRLFESSVQAQNFSPATASKKLNLPLPRESVKSNAMDAGWLQVLLGMAGVTGFGFESHLKSQIRGLMSWGKECPTSLNYKKQQGPSCWKLENIQNPFVHNVAPWGWHRILLLSQHDTLGNRLPAEPPQIPLTQITPECYFKAVVALVQTIGIPMCSFASLKISKPFHMGGLSRTSSTPEEIRPSLMLQIRPGARDAVRLDML